MMKVVVMMTYNVFVRSQSRVTRVHAAKKKQGIIRIPALIAARE